MLDSHPPQSPGRALGLAFIAILILLDAGLLVLIFVVPLGIQTTIFGLLILFSIPLIGVIAYVIAGLRSARYRVKGGLLLIEWGQLRQVVSMHEIIAIIPGEEIIAVDRFRGLRWPGCMLGVGRVHDENGETYQTSIFATRTSEHQVLIVTDSAAYALSPADPFAFAASLRALIDTDLDEDAAMVSSDLDILEWSIWRDRSALILVGVMLALNLALFAFLTAVYDWLPVEVPLHFNRNGLVDRSGSPAGLFILPIIGFFAWTLAMAIGWFFYYIRQEKPVAYVTWGITGVIEMATWVAVVGLLS